MNNMLMNEQYINDLYASGIIKDKEKNIYLKRIENHKLLVQQYYENLIAHQQKNNQDKNDTQEENAELVNSDNLINNVNQSE